MGFASFFEDIVNKTGGAALNQISYREPQMVKDVLKESKSEKTVTKNPNLSNVAISKTFIVPPEYYKLAYSNIKDKVPDYLIDLYIGWMYQFVTHQKLMDEIFTEFTVVGVPQLTKHLNSGSDSITDIFVKNLTKI